MVMIDVGDPQAAREMLFAARSSILYEVGYVPYGHTQVKIDQIRKMIEQIDILRPVDADGNHTDEHTKHCGCPHELEWLKRDRPHVLGDPDREPNATERLNLVNSYSRKMGAGL